MDDFVIDPNQLRWDPPIIPTTDRVDFVEGLTQVCGSGSSSLKDGLCIYTYVASASMGNKVFSSADGDMLIVPQEGMIYVYIHLLLIYLPLIIYMCVYRYLIHYY
jgi:homogentisate 1,2-dioxygenase